MSIVPYIVDDGDTPQYLKGPFTIQEIAINAEIDPDAAIEFARELAMFSQLEANSFDGQQAAQIVRRAHGLE